MSPHVTHNGEYWFGVAQDSNLQNAKKAKRAEYPADTETLVKAALSALTGNLRKVDITRKLIMKKIRFVSYQAET